MRENETNPGQKGTKMNLLDNPFFSALADVNLDKVESTGMDRCTPRKVQAATLRKLLRKLGVKGVSVTAPNYSMAQSVDVRMPLLDVPVIKTDDDPWGRRDVDSVEANANAAANEKFRAILAKAFPNHDDRSDSMTDYFDYCWSF